MLRLDRNIEYVHLNRRIEGCLEAVTMKQLFAELDFEYSEIVNVRCVFPEHREDDNTPSLKCYDNNTVHCFGCQGSGNVVSVTAKVVPDTGAAMPIRNAVDWLERQFKLQRLEAPKRLAERLSKKLSKWRSERKDRSVGKLFLRNLVTKEFLLVQKDHSAEALNASAHVEEWVDEEFELATDKVGAMVWAKRVIHGTYSRTLEVMDYARELQKSGIA